MTIRFRIIALLFLLFASIVSGCGGESDPSSEASDSLPDESTVLLPHIHGSFVLTYDLIPFEDEELQKSAITALHHRIDPVRSVGLIFTLREQNRLEVRGPLAPPQARALRQAFVDARDELVRLKVPRSEIDAALAGDEQARAQGIAALLHRRQVQAEKIQAAAKVDGIASMLLRHQVHASKIQAMADRFEAYERERGPYPDHEQVMAMLAPKGVLSFRVAAQPGEFALAYFRALREEGPDANGDAPFVWVEVDEEDALALSGQPPDRELLESDALTFFARRGLVGVPRGGRYYVLLSNQPGERLTTHENWKVEMAYRTRDDNGFPAIGFHLDPAGGKLLGELTERHIGRMLAVTLDGRAITIARIQSRIDTGGILSRPDGFSPAQVQRMLLLMNTGTLRSVLLPKAPQVRFIEAK